MVFANSTQQPGGKTANALIREAQESRNRLRQMLDEIRLWKANSSNLIAELEVRLARSKKTM